MNITTTGFFLCLLAFIVTTLVYPFVLSYAQKNGIVDNPNARKLQRVPVPVMGGVAVFVGILISVLVSNIQINDLTIWVGFVCMVIMLVIGAIDDIRDIPATLRFIIETALVYGMIVVADIGIDSLHGLWNVGEIPTSISLPLSIIAGVGVINATNLIDGVDGYASGYGIMSCSLYAVLAFYVGDMVIGRLALIFVGSLVPFFLHNVFGRKSKMFIGDSGTLMMGTVMTLFVFSILSKNSDCCVLEQKGLGLVPFTVAVMSIPVFDTLRVMGARVVRGTSPFHPDKTHLHHLFIEMGFSHIGTTLSILLLDFLIVAIWFILWLLGASIDVQFYIVVGLSMFVTFGFYRFMKIQQNRGPKDEDGYPMGTKIWRFFCILGDKSHIERNGMWAFMRKLMDWDWK